MHKILCVDDEEDILFSIDLYLKQSSKMYCFIGLNSGKACIKYLNNNISPDVILLDIIMPEMSGWEIYDKILDNPEWRRIPIVFFSGINDNITKNLEGVIGNGFIQKPIECDDFIRKIDEIININN